MPHKRLNARRLHVYALAASQLTTPHIMLYDLLLLVPAFLLLADLSHKNHNLLPLAVFSYLDRLILSLHGYPFQGALPALIPLAIFSTQARLIWRVGEKSTVTGVQVPQSR